MRTSMVPAIWSGVLAAERVSDALACLNRPGLAGPCRVGLAWRIGAAYEDPATVQITRRDPCAEDERRVREALTERDWLADLLGDQR
jgi:hypothetical protein